MACIDNGGGNTWQHAGVASKFLMSINQPPSCFRTRMAHTVVVGVVFATAVSCNMPHDVLLQLAFFVVDFVVVATIFELAGAMEFLIGCNLAFRHVTVTARQP